MPQTPQYDKSINLFWLVFSDTWIFVRSIFFTTDAIYFHCFYITYSTEFSGFFFSSFISLYSLNTLLTETNPSWLIYELIKALTIRTSIIFNLLFHNNTILLCFFSFFFIIDLHVLLPPVIAQIFITTAELAIPTGIQIYEANAKI